VRLEEVPLLLHVPGLGVHARGTRVLLEVMSIDELRVEASCRLLKVLDAPRVASVEASGPEESGDEDEDNVLGDTGGADAADEASDTGGTAGAADTATDTATDTAEAAPLAGAGEVEHAAHDGERDAATPTDTAGKADDGSETQR
jgi:exoribonuclease-2